MFAITGLVPGSDFFGITNSGHLYIKQALNHETVTSYTVRPREIASYTVRP